MKGFYAHETCTFILKFLFVIQGILKLWKMITICIENIDSVSLDSVSTASEGSTSWQADIKCNILKSVVAPLQFLKGFCTNWCVFKLTNRLSQNVY